jgi:ferredoxin
LSKWDFWLQGSGDNGLKTYRLRLLVQGGFSLLIILLGLQFARFVHQAELQGPEYLAAVAQGVSAEELATRFDLPTRPPGVEGFLPISGFMGVVDWIRQGELNTIHPAATALFLIFIIIAFLLRKAFCAWICPAGFLSELLARLGRRLMGRNFRPWTWLDIVLRSVKYLLLGFFLWAILKMSAADLRGFIESPYNRVSDIKMYWFFAHISTTAVLILIGLAVGSLFINGFWCRYSCPYGALLGLFSWASPARVKRDTASCTSCGICDRVCMARLPVSRKKRIISPECTGCLDCVASCPESNTLTMGPGGRHLNVVRFAAGVVGLFLLGYLLARVTGSWENGITSLEYLREVLGSGSIPHPR